MIRTATPLVSPGEGVPTGLEEQVRANLAARLNNSASYTAEEIERVANLPCGLLPADFNLEFEAGENLRALAKLSQIELRPATLSSHRRFIGPLIVWAKRLTWPLVHIHLKRPFDGLQEFAAQAVTALARQMVEIEKLKKRI